jgi:hypothetical protein
MNTIVVCGFTKTGKVTIAKKLAEQLKRPLIISDNYRSEKYDEFVDEVLTHDRNKTPFIVEGILCFRLLRKGVRENVFYPDLIIKTNCNEATIKYFYEIEGEKSKIPRALSYNKGLNTIWDEYRKLLLESRVKIPKYLELNTSIKI